MNVSSDDTIYQRMVPKFKCTHCDSRLLEIRVSVVRAVTVHCIACARDFKPSAEAKQWALRQCDRQSGRIDGRMKEVNPWNS